jgi:hypothetical protein
MFDGHPINVQGFEIPYNGPLFLTILGIHILAGLTCVVVGLVAMLAKKRVGTHSKSGSIYYWSLLVVFITATVIAVARWREDYHLFILGLISFASAFVGRMSVKNKWQKWSIIHIIGMGLSYIFLLTAFYVDNGKFLPLWKNFNSLFYWLLPTAIGIPILIKTLLQHPSSKEFFKLTSKSL